MEAANIVLSPALQVIFDRLASPVLQKAADFLGFDDNFRGLQHAVERAQATLEDAEDQQFTSRAARLWLSKLKNAAYDAEDDLHYLTAKRMRNGSDYDDMIGMPPVNNHFQLGDLMHATQTGAVLRALEATINEGLSEFNFKAPSMVDGRTTIRETSSFVIESEIYGREDDKEKLVKLLIFSEACKEGYATCISIFGIGGIGKTTLAQLGYNDDRVIHHFDVRMWIFVSDDFNVKKIMKAIIQSATKDECKLSEIDLLQSRIWNLLHNKRYLIVLDDIWTENQDDWDKLRPLFRGDVDGCKIIVTTRNTKTAFMTDSPNSPFYLKGLAEDDCWALFKQRAFGRTEEEKYPWLLSIGKQMVKKCGGVPLAVKSLGSLMRFKREEQQSLFMQNSDLWKLDACQNKVLPALMLSYIHLPSHLKQCFAFCSIFPRNYEFKKQKLIYLWMAEGLILQEGSKRPEDIGENYFADLLWMSFFQEVELCEGVSITGYKMNDVIHDLARYVAGKEYVILEQGAPPNGLAQIRHSSVVYTYGEITILEALYGEKLLRTLLLIGESGSLRSIGKMFSTFVYLRSLDLSSCTVYNLPESLGIMICLRCLDLSYTPIRLLPESTSKLCALQTLNLFGYHNLRSLPFLGGMTDLRV
ncbi:putative disease resistance protein RGA3 [Prunus dulcis]|uniref:putative disease resistance protein RGA3 n=1 Tax=Prunus dulcis TaxID=3755 RepID=UPI0014835299|nr:putative disease resistance protein RGA3 [Prunus dulcis]